MPTHAMSSASIALLPNLWERTALPCASAALSGFHQFFLLRPEAAVCDKPDGTVTACSKLGVLA